MSPKLSMNTMLRAKIRVTKWLSRHMPQRLVYRALIRMSTVPKQKIFQEGFQAADPSKTALDIGANRGIVSYFISQRFGKVHCFEPNADLGVFLEKVLPPNCVLHRCALSHETGQSELSVILESGIPIHGRGRILDASGDAQDYAVQKIRMETLDSQSLKNIGFIKIDVEGHEQKVIRGGINTLRENKPVIVIEIEKRHSGKPVRETLDLIEFLGYDGFFFEDEMKRSTKEYEERMQDPDYPYYVNDFLFLPR